MRARGATIGEIHRELHLFTTYYGYSRMFDNTLYHGTYTFGYDVIEDFCEPIVSPELWNAVRRIKLARMTRLGINHPRAVRSRFWLTGMIYCAACGKPMVGQTSKNAYGSKYDYYRCGGQTTNGSCNASLIPKGVIEQRVMDALRTIVNTGSVLDQVYEEARAQQLAKSVSSHQVLSTIAERVSNNEKQIARLLSAIKDAGHSRTLLDELARLEAQQMELKQASVQADVPPDVPLISRDDITNSISAALDIASDKQRAVILRGFIRIIRAKRINKTIIGNITFQPPGLGEIVLPL